MIRRGEITKNAKIWRPPWNSWLPISKVFPQEFGLTSDLFAEMEKRGEFPHQPGEDIYSRILRVVPSVHLEGLLRKSKETTDKSRADVRITSKNKESLVQQNVRQAVHSGALEQSALESLIQEYEESGKQRIFLHKLRSGERTSDLEFAAVGTRLFGNRFEHVTFPIFHALPQEPEVSSFRRYQFEDSALKVFGFTAKYSEGWLLRVDASVQMDERISPTEPTNSEIRSVTYAPQLVDAVSVVRYWSFNHLLEVRIPNLKTRASALALRAAVLGKFGGAIGFSAFRALTLTPACTNILTTLLDEPGREPGVKRVAGSLLREKDRSTMKIELENQDAGDVRGSPARLRSVREYLKSASQVESMICWFAPPDGSQEIRVVIAADDAHEISIRKQTSAVALDYVVHRLYENSKAHSRAE